MKLDPVMPRGIADEDFEAAGGGLYLFCQCCGGHEFRVRAVRTERHCRVICLDCDVIQSAFTVMWLGRVDGTS